MRVERRRTGKDRLVRQRKQYARIIMVARNGKLEKYRLGMVFESFPIFEGKGATRDF